MGAKGHYREDSRIDLELVVETSFVCLEPAKRGDSIKPGVERSETPGSIGRQGEEPAKAGGQRFHNKQAGSCGLSHASRARFFNFRDPGVPLSSTPGRGPRPSISARVRDFMPPPATRVGNPDDHFVVSFS